MNEELNFPEVTGDLHLARSRCIDAFARAECCTMHILRANDTPISNQPFAQKLALLAKLKASPSYSKAWKTAVDTAAKQLAELLPVRADIVHAPLTLVKLGDERRACFLNPREPTCYSQFARLFSKEDFENLTKRVDAIVRTMAKPVNQASSPRPPSPGAAGVP